MSDKSVDRWFLVERNIRGQLASITAYDDPDTAMAAYADAEFGNLDCVLLGADRLATCIATHGNWFDEPSGLDEAIGAALSRRQNPMPTDPPPDFAIPENER